MADEPDALTGSDLRDLAAHLRSEWHTDYEELVGEARQQWEHGRTLVDRIASAMARGDRLSFSLAGTSFVGPVTNLGTDWCTIATDTGPVDIHLPVRGQRIAMPVVIRTVERSRDGGRRLPQPPMSFRARCFELEMERCAVRVGTTMGDDLPAGTLTVGKDHVTVAGTDHDASVNLDGIAWVAPLRTARR